MSAEKQKDEPDVPSVDPALPSDPPTNEALSADARDKIMDDLKCKLQNLVGTYEDMLEGLSPNIKKRVDYLRDVQKEHDELEQKFLEERATLEAKYQKLYHPLYTKRFEIVTGKVEVEDGVDKAKGGTASEEKEQEKVSDKAEVEETVSEAKEGTGSEEKEQEEIGIPEFWLNAMRNNEVLGDEIESQDEEALKYLTDIKWKRIDDHKGFKLEFFFEPNPFFKNSVLTKIYSMIDEDEPILEKAIGTEIEWYPGKCLTQKILKKKPKGTATGAKPITKTEKCCSFFNFFDPPNVPEDGEEMDEDSAEQLQNQIEEDFDVGSVIKNKIIPHAVSWFTGEAIKDEDFQIIEVEDDDDDEGEDDEEDEDDEEEDEKDEDGESEGKKMEKEDGQANAGEVKTGDPQA